MNSYYNRDLIPKKQYLVKFSPVRMKHTVGQLQQECGIIFPSSIHEYNTARWHTITIPIDREYVLEKMCSKGDRRIRGYCRAIGL